MPLGIQGRMEVAIIFVFWHKSVSRTNSDQYHSDIVGSCGSASGSKIQNVDAESEFSRSLLKPI